MKFRVAMSAVMLLFAAGSAAGQGVTATFSPVSSQVSPGAEFTLEITVPVAGTPFNGFDAVVGYDPAALTLLPTSPLSLQEGALMWNACHNTFHIFRQGASTDTITDVLLCGGMSLTGPGQIYKLKFRASSTPQVTHVRFLMLQFYNAGMYVDLAGSTDAVIGIGMSPVAVESPPAPDDLNLRIVPNPANRSTTFEVGAVPSGSFEISVVDAAGRLVRHFEGASAAGSIVWDGRDGDGRAVPAGIYYARLDSGGVSRWGRVAIVR